MRITPTLLLAALAGATGLSHAAKEVAAFGVDNFENSGTCDSSDLDHSWRFADYFVDAFEDHNWDQGAKWMNKGVDPADWVDDTKKSYGNDDNDPYGVDFADVGLISTHGAHNHTSNYSYFVMGEAHEGQNCRPRTTDHMRFGVSGGDLEVLILAACQTAQYDVWNNSGYFHVRRNAGTFTTWLGFHGNSYDSKTDARGVRDYVNTSFSNGLGDNWLDEMYRYRVANHSQCPTAIIFCDVDQKSDCTTQYDWGGFNDRFKVSSNDDKNNARIFYLSGCNPSSGWSLP